MRSRLAVSRAAVELIKAFEGFRPKAAQLDDGRWTVGYGHTQTAREGAEVSEQEAEALLLYDLIGCSHAVNEHVFAPLNQNQFDALVAFIFNIGVRNFRGSTTLRRLNEGRTLEAAIAMDLWRKADVEGERIVVDALVRRRAAEKALFLRPVEGWMPAPTPVLPPKLDYDALGMLPLQSPVATQTSLGGDRATVERAPEWPYEPEQPPSASEAAAEAVIERLEALIAAPAGRAEAGGNAPTAAPEDEGGAAPPLVARIGPEPRPKPRRAHPLVLLALAAIGVALLLAAAVWGFSPSTAESLGLPPQLFGLGMGAFGIVAIAVATYFLLERLGMPRATADRA